LRSGTHRVEGRFGARPFFIGGTEMERKIGKWIIKEDSENCLYVFAGDFSEIPLINEHDVVKWDYPSRIPVEVKRVVRKLMLDARKAGKPYNNDHFRMLSKE
jgi:hypothetical protein